MAPAARSPVDLHQQLRAWLRATMPDEAPDAVIYALHYELVSMAAATAEHPTQAAGFLRALLPLALELLETHGVGMPFPLETRPK